MFDIGQLVVVKDRHPFFGKQGTVMGILDGYTALVKLADFDMGHCGNDIDTTRKDFWYLDVEDLDFAQIEIVPYEEML